MPPRPGCWLLFLFLVTTSGCAGLFGGAERVDTATPAPVPTQQATLPPGITTEGVTDPQRLTAANGRVLNGTAYELERTVRVRGPNGTVRIQRTQRGTPDGVIKARLSVSGEGPVETAVENWTRYRESDVVWSRANLSGGRTVTNRLPPGNGTTYFLGRTLPLRLFSAGSFEVARASERAVVLRSRAPFDLDRGVTEIRVGRARNVSVRAVVTERGLVRNISVTYTAETDSEEIRIRVTQSVSTPESVAVERPPWVSEAQ